ncbi:MAG: four helix bundle protein [Candidatus Omnitrophota bacterium]
MRRNFRNIKAWQRSDDMVMLVYKKSRSFPREELYGLTSQLRRAALSVPTNIAEGASRDFQKEYLQFLNIASGSISEVEYLLHVSKRLNYLNEKDYFEIEIARKEAAKLLHGLIVSVKNDK